MPIIRKAIADLTPYDANPRTHPTRQVDQLATLIKKFGFHDSHAIAVDEQGVIIWGHGRLQAARQAGLTDVPVEVLTGLSEEDKRALRIADNSIAEQSDWDMDLLQQELDALNEAGYQLELLALDDSLLEELGGIFDPGEGGFGGGDFQGDPDEVPEVDEEAEPVAKRGDVWRLGRHRVMCGDSTDAGDVARLMDGERVVLLHADPPYGMGKEKDGVENDNLYRDKLDAFQMAWWRVFREYLEDNANAYIWGNAEDLWRLWYVGGLKDSERFTFRNEIIWDKKNGQGMESEQHRMFPTATERCLFFMLGEQGFNNNADNYWDGWEPIRSYFSEQQEAMEWIRKDINAILGSTKNGGGMASHIFSTSQFSLPTEALYAKLQTAAKGDAFKREYDDLKREYDDLKREWYATRAYFDNTHDNMTDVWSFPRVTGEERHGHATPKPVDMITRIVKSSSPEGAVIVEPFGGSGSTLIAAEKTGRDCRMMELSPRYVDVIIKRWEDYTGGKAERCDGV
jgi:DNA modification methylase